MPAVWVNLWQSVGSFSFSISLDHEAVFLAALQRDLHKAELLIASLQGARLDSASHPFFCEKKKKERNLRNSGKRISAYAWSPLWSLSNKRRSFNLVATGAFHYTRHAQIRARKVSAPPPLQRPRRVGWPHKVDEHVCDWKCLITNIYFLQHCNHLLIYIYILSILCKKGTYDDDFFNVLTMRCAFHQAYQTISVLQCITFFFLNTAVFALAPWSQQVSMGTGTGEIVSHNQAPKVRGV